MRYNLRDATVDGLTFRDLEIGLVEASLPSPTKKGVDPEERLGRETRIC